MDSRHEASVQAEILRYWLGDPPHDPLTVKTKQKVWYAGEENIDREIQERFGAVFDQACSESLLHWGETADGALALVILLDQFSRNLHRGTSAAFGQDALARAVAMRAINLGLDQKLSVPGRVVLLHPFHHSENLVDQEFGCAQLREMIAEGHTNWQELLTSCLQWFDGHHAIVRRFLRFPHRNKCLGRPSTAEEEKYLAESSSFGQ